MIRLRKRCVLLIVTMLVAVLAGAVMAQQTAQTPSKPPAQNVPDAPSASRPPQPFPMPPAASTAPLPGNEPAPPEPNVQQVPAGGATPTPGSSRDQLFTLTKNVNFVVVPITVKDSSGHLVEGLGPRDFSVYEDDKEQKISFFTSDPFPLSAAVVLDLGISDVVFRKVKETLPALVGAFGQFDEVGLYTFGNTVQRVAEFTAVDGLSTAVDRLKKKASGRTGGVPVVGGPMGSSGPMVNGRPLDPGVRPLPTYERESKVLNDAILAAAQDLARREPTRRKMLFVISDGLESGSTASYGEVLKVLLSRQITVYAVGVGGAAIPGYGQAGKIHLPGMGYGNILPKYASATGGQVFDEFSQSAIERAYGRVTEEARNQYTLGYTTRATASSAYRSIEVRVDHPGLKVYARDGYYPLPPGR
jgi:VWFA-related protein